MYTFLSLQVHSTDTTQIARVLADKVQQAPGFFSNTPVVVDLTRVESSASLDAGALLKTIRDNRLVPVVVGLSDRGSALADSLDIPVVEIGVDRPRTDETGQHGNAADRDDAEADDTADETMDETGDSGLEDDEDDDVAVATRSSAGTSRARRRKASTEVDLAIDLAMSNNKVEFIIKPPKLVTRPVRSGQQVYAKDTDLVVLGQIGPGAELIADNNIHVYGPLRGRALCGVGGNTNARIFCQSLEAELVSVAGTYKVLEEIPDTLRGRPAQIWYSVDQDRLMIEAL